MNCMDIVCQKIRNTMRKTIEISREDGKSADSHILKDNSISKKLRTFWKEFCEDTSCHGLGKITCRDRKYKLRRFFWIFCVLVSTAFLAWVVYKEFHAYGEYPTFTKIEINHFDEVRFPAVTICNMSPLSKAKINDSSRLENYFMSITGLRHWALPINWSDPGYQEEGFFEPLNKVAALSFSRTTEEMFKACSFDQEVFDCDTNFKQIHSDFGLCYTWNSKGNIFTKRSGATNNLQIIMNVNVTDYFWSNDIATGVKIVVHDHLDEPDVENKGFVVAPGTISYTGVVHMQYTYLPPPYKIFADETCVERDSEDITGQVPKGQIYSYHNCMRHCRSRYIKQVCGCIHTSDPGDGPYCSLYQYKECYLIHIGNSTTRQKCKCRLPCEINSYSLEQSYGHFPSPYVAEKLVHRKLATSFDQLRENFLVLKIYFNNLSTYRFKQLPKYSSVVEVLGNLGGDMGLFLGASILTVTELCEFIVIGLVSVTSVLWKRRLQPAAS